MIARAALWSFAAVLALGAGCGRQPAETTPGSGGAATNTPAATTTAEAKPEFLKLKGRWERSGDPYILEITDVAADGKLQAGYFNPSPIHVERAVAYSENGETRVAVELRDVNYPGCLYKLSYDPKSDQLFGTYFQAAIQQTYDVTFGRVKD